MGVNKYAYYGFYALCVEMYVEKLLSGLIFWVIWSARACGVRVGFCRRVLSAYYMTFSRYFIELPFLINALRMSVSMP